MCAAIRGASSLLSNLAAAAEGPISEAILPPGLPTSSHIPTRLLAWGWGMSNQATARSPSFGAIDRPACPYCGERASLTRRSPHPDYDLRYERQMFICSACDHAIERIVDASGNSPE
jgi:hypothetical protein